MNQKEKIIIDMRQSTKHELLVLSKLLLALSSVCSCHGLKITVKKSSKPFSPCLPASPLSHSNN